MVSGRRRTCPHTHSQLGVHCSLPWKARCLPSGAGLMDISAQQSPNFSIMRPPWGSPTEIWPMSWGKYGPHADWTGHPCPRPAPAVYRTTPGLSLAELLFPLPPSNLPGFSVDLEGTLPPPLFHSSCHILRLSSPASCERHQEIPGREMVYGHSSAGFSAALFHADCSCCLPQW